MMRPARHHSRSVATVATVATVAAIDAFVALVAIIAFAGRLPAQVVTGTVVAGDSVTPVPGAMLLATDARGASAGRAMTSVHGTFVLRLAVPGTVHLRVLRIGYRPTEGPTLTVGAGATDTVRIVFAGQAVTLAAVNVHERETCRVSADTGLAVARVWEEARKAMLASELSADGPPLFAEWIEYDRTLDSTMRVVKRQRVTTSRHPTTHAFHSLPADSLALHGYVVADSSGTTFYAPDADVLLSDRFVAGHCVHLVPSDRTADLIGVVFQPSRDRRDDHDIEGTLWVDRRTAELQTLEFHYTNLPEVAELANPGGVVQFLRLASGVWLVGTWSVRMPELGLRPMSSEGGQRKVIMTGSRSVLRAVHVTGGEVTRVLRDDSLVYLQAGPAIDLQLVATDSTIPAAAARLELDGTDYSSIADAHGRMHLSPVLAGRYRARIRTPLMDTLGMPAISREIETRPHGATGVDSVDMPAPRALLRSACPRDSIANGEGMLYGTVRDARANPIGHAAVTVSWQANISLIGAADGDHLSYANKTVGTLTDDAGYWRLCGVPRLRSPLLVGAVSDSGSDYRSARLFEGEVFKAVDLVVHPQSAALRELTLAVNPVARPRALVELIVTGTDGSPVPETALDISFPGGSPRTLVTGPSGRALVPDIAPGVLTARARHIGFTPGIVAVTVAEGRNTVPIILSAAAAPSLDTVRVVGDQVVRSRLDEFETRRLNHQATVSFTRADILKRNPADAWQMLTNVPSILIADNDTMVVARSARGSTKGLLDISPCYVQVMVDGIVKNKLAGDKGYDLRDLPRPDEIHGIEVFAGPASIPLQYGGIGGAEKWCGLIAVWTR